jgi:CPA2 family monovalent cation:H+ antiporter-2
VLLVLGLTFGLRGADRWLLALGLAQAGEFGFVLLSFSVANAVLPQGLADQLLLVIALSMLLTPLLFILYDRVIAPRYAVAEDRAADDIDEAGEVIIAGYGRVGTVIDRMLSAAGYKTTVIDYNSQQIENLRRFGARVYFGDASRPDLLHAAGIERARILVVAIDDEAQTTEITRYARQNFPELHVIARARNRHHVYHLWAVGCRDIIRETYDSSLRMGRSVFEAMGIPHDRAQAMANAFDRMDRKAMIQAADAYDLDIPVMENQAYIDTVKEIRGPWQEELGREMAGIRDGRPAAGTATPDAQDT